MVAQFSGSVLPWEYVVGADGAYADIPLPMSGDFTVLFWGSVWGQLGGPIIAIGDPTNGVLVAPGPTWSDLTLHTSVTGVTADVHGLNSSDALLAHTALVRRGDRVEVFSGGILAVSASFTPTQWSRGHARFGCNLSCNLHFDPLSLYDILVYERALTAPEVALIETQEVNAPCARFD